jgi:hypothetical protein
MSNRLKLQTVPIVFNQGITDNTVDEAQDIKKVITAQNGWFNNDYLFESATGYTKLDELNNYSLNNVFQYKNSFLAAGNSKLYSYSGLSKFTQVGTIDSVAIQSEGIYRSGSLTVTNQDMYINPVTNIACLTWYEATSGQMYAIYDITNKSYLVAPTLLNSLVTMARVCYISSSNTYIILGAKPSTTEILSYAYNMNTNTLSSPVTMKSDLRNTNIGLDCIQYLGGDGVTVAYTNTSNQLGLFHITRTNTLGTSSNGYYTSSTDTSITIQKALSITRVDTDFVICYNENSSNNVKARWFGSDFLALTSIQTLGTLTAATTANAITAIATATSTIRVFVDEINATINYGKLFTTSITKSASSSSLTRLFTGTMIAGKAFLNANSTGAVICIYKSTLQSSYFVLDSNGKINTQFSVGIAGDNSTTSQLDIISNSQVSNSYIYSALLNKGRLTSEQGVFTTLSGIILAQFQNLIYRSSVEMNDSLYISGGYTKVFDGKVVHEAGFTLYPENLSVTSEVTGAGGTIDVGTYNYKAVFEYYDSTGRVHESKTSPALTYTVTTGGATHSLTVRIPSILVSEKDKVIVSLYRTKNGDTTYYKVSSLTSPTTITPSTNTYVDITDTLNDSVIGANQPIYTTGGVLDNAPFPASKLIKNINGRLWFGLCENRRLVYFSKLSNQFQAVNTASEFYFDTLEGGEVLGLAELGNSTIVYKVSGVYLIVGSPANNLGANSTLQPIRKIVSNITTISERTVFETVDGIFFMSRFGIQLLKPDGTIFNFANPVSNRVVSSDVNFISYVERLKHLRLHTSTTCWVFDYLNNSWYEWQFFGATSGAVIDGYQVFTKPDGFVRREANIYSVDSAPFDIVLRTGWFRAMALSVQRIYSVHPILKYFNDHNLQVNLYYDNEINKSETFDTQSSNITGSYIYGTGTYGDQTYYGGSIGYNNVYQPEIQPARQECESMSVEIRIYNDGNSIGKACGIIGFNLVAGVVSQELQRKQSKRISGR